METMNIVNTQMYIDGCQVKLVSDTSYESLWEVSFTLKEFKVLGNHTLKNSKVQFLGGSMMK